MIAIVIFGLWILASVSLLSWFYILLHPARPWDFQPVGDDGPIPDLPPEGKFPPIAVLVPARNEAESLPNTLPALLSQEYPGTFRVILIDDRSEDGTAEVARGIAEKLTASDKLTVLRGLPLPEGWTGKVWALDQGVKEAAKMRSEFVLLTDADILHRPSSLRRLVSESITGELGLNSRMARLRCESPAERLLIPAFVYFFNLLYPMRRINDRGDTLAGAAGGCVLLSVEAVKRLNNGFYAIKSEIIDDVNLARQVKKAGLPIRLSLSRDDVLSLRDYPRLIDIWKMVRRTAFTELKYSWVRLLGAMAGLTLIFVVPILAFSVGLLAFVLCTDLGLKVYALIVCAKGMISLLVMRNVYSPAVRFFNLPARFTFTLPIAGFLYGMMTLDSALRHARKARTEWREVGGAIKN
jgi:hopene-associated glycosyltransferase HpnB